jgi:glutathione S-transferase
MTRLYLSLYLSFQPTSKGLIMKLYYSPGACSLAVHISLIEAGIPFDLAKVNLRTHQLEDGSDFYQISPRGYVPTLEIKDGSRHTEVAALLQYIADLSPKDALIPSAPIERLQTISWLTFISTELHKTLGWLWVKDLAESTKIMVLGRIEKRLAELDQLFVKQDYLMKTFTVADAYCFTVLNWARMVNLDISHHTHLAKYLVRVSSRPSTQQALKTEGLI